MSLFLIFFRKKYMKGIIDGGFPESLWPLGVPVGHTEFQWKWDTWAQYTDSDSVPCWQSPTRNGQVLCLVAKLQQFWLTGRFLQEPFNGPSHPSYSKKLSHTQRFCLMKVLEQEEGGLPSLETVPQVPFFSSIVNSEIFIFKYQSFLCITHT